MAVQYENAPIREALIDLRFEVPLNTSPGTLDGFYQGIRTDFPVKRTKTLIQAQFVGGSEIGASTKQVDDGFRYDSADGRRVLQVGTHSFTFSRLRPYGNWIELRDEARRLWESYREALGPRTITRIAVRYINQIELPGGALDYKDYFLTTPEVAPGLPQSLSSFFMQLFLPQPHLEAMVVLTQASVPSSDKGAAGVILDIDVYGTESGPLSEEEMWARLDRFRDLKNQFFECSITDLTRSLFGLRKEY